MVVDETYSQNIVHQRTLFVIDDAIFSKMAVTKVSPIRGKVRPRGLLTCTEFLYKPLLFMTA